MSVSIKDHEEIKNEDSPSLEAIILQQQDIQNDQSIHNQLEMNENFFTDIKQLSD